MSKSRHWFYSTVVIVSQFFACRVSVTFRNSGQKFKVRFRSTKSTLILFCFWQNICKCVHYTRSTLHSTTSQCWRGICTISLATSSSGAFSFFAAAFTLHEPTFSQCGVTWCIWWLWRLCFCSCCEFPTFFGRASIVSRRWSMQFICWVKLGLT